MKNLRITMRNTLYLVLAIVLYLGCVKDYSESKYIVTYITGETQKITHIGTMVYLSNDKRMCKIYDGCVYYMTRNAHGSSTTICGVRSIKLISYKEDFH